MDADVLIPRIVEIEAGAFAGDLSKKDSLVSSNGVTSDPDHRYPAVV